MQIFKKSMTRIIPIMIIATLCLAGCNSADKTEEVETDKKEVAENQKLNELPENQNVELWSMYQVGEPVMTIKSPYDLNEITIPVDPNYQATMEKMKTLDYNNGNQENFMQIMVNYIKYKIEIEYKVKTGMDGAIQNLQNNPMVKNLKYKVEPREYGGRIKALMAVGSYELQGKPLSFKMQIISDTFSQWSVMTQNTPGEINDALTTKVHDTVTF